MGETSGTGVAFTRSPSSGDRAFFGECLMNAQGEDVVAGIRTPLPVTELAKKAPEAYKELGHTYKKLEKHYRDMLDLEFTIQEGKLYMLQTRVGKRTGIAAVKIAVDMVKEGLISRQEAVLRIGPDQIAQYLYPIFDTHEESKSNPLGKGLPAGPGASAGKFDPELQEILRKKASSLSGRYSWHECGDRIFDGPWRDDVACGGRGSADGQSLCGGLRCRGSSGWPERENWGQDLQGGRLPLD